jgi:predicted ATPase
MYRLTMVKQISLDAWSLQHLTDLLKKGSQIVAKTNTPIVLYRQTMEEEDGSY